MQYIFVHGLGQNALSWDKTISFMAEPLNVECLNLSALLHDKEITYANLCRSFSEYCDRIQVTVNLCGLSLGA